MSDIKKTVAKNLAELRTTHNMTQLELAEKLNYSDKAVSKWEHAESMPDLTVLVEIADMFGVSLDYLIKEDHSATEVPFENKKAAKYSRTMITLVSLSSVVFFAVLSFVLTQLLAPHLKYDWLCFIYAIPVSAIVWLVLNSIWFNQKTNYLIISILMWSVLVAIHLTVFMFGANIWLIYLLGIPSQIIILLSSFVRRRTK